MVCAEDWGGGDFTGTVYFVSFIWMDGNFFSFFIRKTKEYENGKTIKIDMR